MTPPAMRQGMGTDGWPQGQMAQAIDRISETQALLASLVAERRENEGLGLGPGASGSDGSAGGTSVRGVQMVMKNRARFQQNPEARWHHLNDRVKELLHWQEGMLWSLEALMLQWPWGYQRTLKRTGFMLCRVYAELNRPTPQLGMIRGLVAQMIKVNCQAALDHGNFDMAMTYWPYPDPVSSSDCDPVPPSLEQADPFAGLGSPEELAAGMSYLRDAGSLAKARGERRKTGQKEEGGKGGKNPDKSKEGKGQPPKEGK